MKEICSHEGNTFTQREYVHMKELCNRPTSVVSHVHTLHVRSPVFFKSLPYMVFYCLLLTSVLL